MMWTFIWHVFLISEPHKKKKKSATVKLNLFIIIFIWFMYLYHAVHPSPWLLKLCIHCMRITLSTADLRTFILYPLNLWKFIGHKEFISYTIDGLVGLSEMDLGKTKDIFFTFSWPNDMNNIITVNMLCVLANA